MFCVRKVPAIVELAFIRVLGVKVDADWLNIVFPPMPVALPCIIHLLKVRQVAGISEAEYLDKVACEVGRPPDINLDVRHYRLRLHR